MEFGLIAKRLGHSFSPAIHAMIGGYDYQLCELTEDELPAFLKARQFRGLNVTIPYKETVIPLLDHISDEARQIGAVNTVVNRDGTLWGYNTDLGGMTALAQHAGVSLAGKTVLIAGSGGTSKTAAAMARAMGASQVLRAGRRSQSGCVSYEEAYCSGAQIRMWVIAPISFSCPLTPIASSIPRSSAMRPCLSQRQLRAREPRSANAACIRAVAMAYLRARSTNSRTVLPSSEYVP